ncbi:MAG: tRNA (adenosine(37)-N6)-dimethylallyltransferase MiaA [Fibrobacter sp.]|jgi:tRNA dimethylallyltransferase|nr:tRNA (adenosine(37)-N6)-dimethylallyltransferase MiaA [Fibrobacter sp.]
MPILFALVGPTGVGKTELGMKLAKERQAEVICMDSRQVYEGFRIGTAQPTAEERAAVKHHLVDFFSPRESYSAGLFCEQVKDVLAAAPETNFIIVGGSGLYLKSLSEGLPALPKPSPEIRERLKAEKESEGLLSQYKRATEIDPEAMLKIKEGDAQRIWRVLEVYEQTKELFSSLSRHRVGGLGAIETRLLDLPAPELRARQAARFEAMIAAGWLEEVENLSKVYPKTCPAFESLGYAELREYLEHGTDFKAIRGQILQRQWQYTRRQRTWNRHQISA